MQHGHVISSASVCQHAYAVLLSIGIPVCQQLCQHTLSEHQLQLKKRCSQTALAAITEADAADMAFVWQNRLCEAVSR